jgi:hypothetical protein
MSSFEEYPVVLRCDGLRGRPSQVVLMGNGMWRVDWIEGLVSLYRADPRAHLRLGYEPRHLRWWQPSRQYEENCAPRPVVGLGH